MVLDIATIFLTLWVSIKSVCLVICWLEILNFNIIKFIKVLFCFVFNAFAVLDKKSFWPPMSGCSPTLLDFPMNLYSGVRCPILFSSIDWGRSPHRLLLSEQSIKFHVLPVRQIHWSEGKWHLREKKDGVWTGEEKAEFNSIKLQFLPSKYKPFPKCTPSCCLLTSDLPIWMPEACKLLLYLTA